MSENEDVKRCYTCAHYFAQECRRYPPSAMVIGSNRFPIVVARDFCGEWKAKENDRDRS